MRKTPDPQTQKNGRPWSAAAMWKTTIHGDASIITYVALNPPRKRASKVYSQALKTSYSSRRRCVACRRKRELDWSRVRQTTHRICPIRTRARADLSQPTTKLVPKGKLTGKNRGAAAAKSTCARNAASRSRMPGNPRRHFEKVSVAHHQSVAGGTAGWFDGADLECRPSSARSRRKRAGDPFPAPRTV